MYLRGSTSRMGVFPGPRARLYGLRGLRGLGAATPQIVGGGPGATPSNPAMLPQYLPAPGEVCPAWGCGPAPIHITPTPPGPPPGPVINEPPTAPPITSGTPVPTGFPTNQFFVNNDGTVWEFSASQNTWINTGTPYNVASPPAPSAPAAAAPITSGGYYAGTPVPIGYPTSDIFVASDGSQWQYSATLGTWYQTSGATGGVVATAPNALTSGYQSILDWLSQNTLIGGIPNWAVAAGVAVLVLRVSKGKGR